LILKQALMVRWIVRKLGWWQKGTLKFTVVWILRYVKSSPEKICVYIDRGHTNNFGYSDAEWASDIRSISGCCVLIDGN
jgi:hypothetical protein